MDPRIRDRLSELIGLRFALALCAAHPPASCFDFDSKLLCDFLPNIHACLSASKLCLRPTMTSKEVAKCDAGEHRRRSPLDHLPPPANSNKPLTPFSIDDILNKPSVKRSYTICGTAHLISSSEKHRPSGIPLSSRALLTQTSPLCALEELASKTFKGLEVSVLQAAEGKPPSYYHYI